MGTGNNAGFLILLVGLVGLVAGGPYLEQRAYIAFFGLDEIADNVFVNRDMPAARRTKFLGDLTRARQVITGWLGPRTGRAGRPRLVACSNWDCYVRLGGQRPTRHLLPHGVAYGSRFFRMSPAGIANPFSVIHELTHIEVAARLRAMNRFAHLPQWFDEGLASIISGEPRYSERAWQRLRAAGIRLPDVTGITDSDEWMQALRTKRFVYLAAAQTVHNWLKAAGGRPAVRELMRRVGAGEAFATVYDELARRHSGRKQAGQPAQAFILSSFAAMIELCPGEGYVNPAEIKKE